MYLACPSCKLQYDVSHYPEGTEVRCKCGADLTVPAHAATEVSCATCGASVPGDAETCPYCKGAVRRAVCPACFRGLRKDAKFCDGCGEPIRPQTIRPPEATDRSCPRCDGTLFHTRLDAYAMDQCGTCGGLWVDASTVEAIMADRPQAVETGVAPDLSVGGGERSGLLTGEFQGRAYVPCPRCTKIMTPQNYARYSGIIVDVCKDHGIWFDAGELNRILEFVARGGLVKARKKESERAIEEARSAKLDAQAAQIRAAYNPPVHGSTMGSRGGPGGGLLIEALVEGLFSIFKR